MHPGNAENPEADNEAGHSVVPIKSFILKLPGKWLLSSPHLRGKKAQIQCQWTSAAAMAEDLLREKRQ